MICPKPPYMYAVIYFKTLGRKKDAENLLEKRETRAAKHSRRLSAW